MAEKNQIIINPKNYSIIAIIFLVGMMISAAIFFGLKSSQSGQKAEIPGTDSQPSGQKQQNENQLATVSIDDDAFLGDKDTAKVAIVEFSDYECPYCKKFRDQTFDQIKTNFIDTGKAILVYRDLPLSFHEPAASREALAAECAKDQKGNEAYFQYHDQIYKTTQGNGAGIEDDKLIEIADNIGLNQTQFEECLSSNKFGSEIKKDASDAAKLGINGTPGFVIGKLDADGNVKGVIVSGAQPYSVFSDIIQQQLI